MYYAFCDSRSCGRNLVMEQTGQEKSCVHNTVTHVIRHVAFFIVTLSSITCFAS